MLLPAYRKVDSDYFEEYNNAIPLGGYTAEQR
jgi:UDP-galactopyranose mutase